MQMSVTLHLQYYALCFLHSIVQISLETAFLHKNLAAKTLANNFVQCSYNR